MNARFQMAIGKIRDALLSILNREFLIFFGFLGISAFFWVLQTLNDDYEEVFSVPVVYRNVPDNVVITSNPPEFIKVTIKDQGYALLDYKLRKTLKPIVFDFNQHESKGYLIHITNGDIHKQLADNLSNASKLVSFKPESFDVVYTRGKAKKVPVRFAGNANAKQQYEITQIIASPDSVLIYAPEEVLDTVSGMYIRPVSYHELDDSITTQVELSDVPYIKAIPNNVDLHIFVEQLTEKSLEVPVSTINVPEGKILRTFPSKVKVTFQTVLSYYKSVNPNNFIIQIDYNDIIQTGSTHAVPTVLAPSIIKHLRISPKEVDFLLEETIAE